MLITLKVTWDSLHDLSYSIGKPRVQPRDCFFFAFCCCLWLKQSSFHWTVNDGVMTKPQEKSNVLILVTPICLFSPVRERSYASDYDSVGLMTPLMTPILDFHWLIGTPTTPVPLSLWLQFFYFHWIISARTTPITTPTPSLVKTSLYGLLDSQRKFLSSLYLREWGKGRFQSATILWVLRSNNKKTCSTRAGVTYTYLIVDVCEQVSWS